MISISNLEPHEWNDLVDRFHGDYRQYYEWSILKKIYGWEIEQYLISENKKIVACCQILIKKIWPLIFIYFPGSVCGDQEKLKIINNHLKKKYKIFFLKYFRFDITSNKILNHDEYLKKQNLKKSTFYRTGNIKISYDLTKSFDEIINSASRSWKKNYKYACKQNLKYIIEKEPDTNLIYKLSRDLERQKKIGRGHSHEEIISIFKIMKNKILFVKTLDEKDKVISFRAALLNNLKAFDFFAITTTEGKKKQSGYFDLMNLFKELQKKSYNEYYFLGNNLKKDNLFFFKSKLGGKINEYIGECDYSNIFGLRLLFNLLLFLKYSNKLPFFNFKSH